MVNSKTDWVEASKEQLVVGGVTSAVISGKQLSLSVATIHQVKSKHFSGEIITRLEDPEQLLLQ